MMCYFLLTPKNLTFFQTTTPRGDDDNDDNGNATTVHTTAPNDDLSTTFSTTDLTTALQQSSTTATTPPRTTSCICDAILCLDDVIYIFSGSDVIEYSLPENLVRRSDRITSVLSLFQRDITEVAAAYSDLSSVYVVTGNRN